ncbi:MAG UNVERIFIED_CONTAM: tetratricopeptide repeat protein [Rickettsiaceae bacterium]
MERRKNREYLEDVITKLINAVPKGVVKAVIFRESKTIYENLEVIAQNAEKYNIDIYKLLELNLQLIIQYVNGSNLYNAKILVDWFNKNEEEGKYKTWLMNNNEKSIYARYLGMLGWYNRRAFDYSKAYGYYIRELKIYEDVTGFESSKCNAYFGLALTNISLGQVEEASQNIQKMEEMFNNNLVDKADIGTLLAAKSVLCYILGQYKEALEYIDKNIDSFLTSGGKDDDLYLTNPYILKSELLAHMGKYDEAYIYAMKIHDMAKVLQGKNNMIVGRIYSRIAYAEFGQNKLDKALKDNKKAISIFLSDERRKSKDKEDTNGFNDPDLGFAYVVEGDILSAQKNFKEAMESYKKAEKIYNGIYKENLGLDKVSILYYKIATTAEHLKDNFLFRAYLHKHEKLFGIDHERTLSLYAFSKDKK